MELTIHDGELIKITTRTGGGGVGKADVTDVATQA